MKKIMEPLNLFPGMKNYWFFYGNDGPAQFVLTYGSVKSRLKMNGHSAKFPNYAVLLWGYHPKIGKRVLIETSNKLSFPPKGQLTVSFDEKGYKINHNEMKINFGKKYSKTKPVNIGKVVNFVNEYRYFKGKMFGEKIKGKGYLQKVTVGVPFISWDWVRFHGNSLGELFKVKFMPRTIFKLNGKKYPVRLTARDGKLHILSDKVDITSEPYANHVMAFSGLGEFKYTEYFVKFTGEVEGKKILDYGIVEKARGFVF